MVPRARETPPNGVLSPALSPSTVGMWSKVEKGDKVSRSVQGHGNGHRQRVTTEISAVFLHLLLRDCLYMDLIRTVDQAQRASVRIRLGEPKVLGDAPGTV